MSRQSSNEKIHGIVLPEVSLNRECADAIVAAIKNKTKLELLIFGLQEESSSVKGPAKNLAFTYLFSPEREMVYWSQSKHHRWKLNSTQITQYKLTEKFDLKRNYWEEICIGDRSISFYLFRPGASLATIICEDLARIDPVQPIIRSIGPNLVISLLQDGPQWLSRWPGRYSTVLSEDPGSSVLTFTSLGMVERSMLPGDLRTARTVGLWKDGKSPARELDLPKNALGLILKLQIDTESNMTLDGRSDDGETKVIVLKDSIPIYLERIPGWLRI